MFQDELRKRPLKAKFLDLYYNKSHIKCYNFYQQSEDHFAIANTKGQNRVPFAATFLWEQALF